MTLVINACDATSEGATVTLSTRILEVGSEQAAQEPEVRARTFMQIAVADTGTAIAAEYRSHLFQPLFTTEPVGEGNGLGLVTICGMVRQHGWVEVVSGPGEGARFRFHWQLLTALCSAAAGERISSAVSPAAAITNGSRSRSAMSDFFRRCCWPVLRLFERGEVPDDYRPLHRRILWVVAALFMVLALLSLFFAFGMQEWGALVPLVVFLAGSLISAIVGMLGSDRAVARLWGMR